MKITTTRTQDTLVGKSYVHVAFSRESDITEFAVDNGEKRMVVGLEEVLPVTARRFRLLARRVVAEAKQHQIKKLVVHTEDLAALQVANMERGELLRSFVENVHMANYEFVLFKEKPKKGWRFIEEIALVGDFGAQEKAHIKIGETVAAEVNACRDLANTPGGDMTPKLLAKKAKEAAKGTDAIVTVLGKKEMQKLKMGAILGVAKGSTEEPQFIIVEYKGGRAKDAPVVLVGKGVTFDTGGLNLKPSDSILDMNLDMSGGAAVIHAVIAAAKLKLPVNAVALVPAAENMVSGESYRPGDILRSMSGKTIEVLNTDAEGRLLLADALTYAKKYKPKKVVDVATLTGAALVALGMEASAVLSPNDELARALIEDGEVSGDYLWQLPLWEEYKTQLKGRFADVPNIPTENPRVGGTINGGMFLSQFAEGYDWAHIDMAPRMEAHKNEFLAQGAAGAPVRLLVRLLEH